MHSMKMSESAANSSGQILSQGLVEEKFAKGLPVFTPYGVGEIEAYRPEQKQVVVALANNGGKAYLQDEHVRRKKRLFEMDDEDKLAQSKLHREEGNLFFKLEDYSVASHKYELARVYLRQMLVNNKEEHLSLLNNIALTGIKLKNYSDAVSTCDESIANHFTSTGDALNPAEVKCLYLRAMANRKRGDLDSALRDLIKAVKAAPKNKSVREEYESVVKELKATQEKEATIFKRAFKESENKEQEAETVPKLTATVETSQLAARSVSVDVRGGSESFVTRFGPTLIIGAAAIGLALIILSRRER